jgi:RES domain-containing protein
LTRVYRILRKPYSKKPLILEHPTHRGEGAYRFGGRWSSPGTRLAYTAEHLSLAMIEYFIHIDPGDPPNDLVLLTAEIPDNVSRTSISPRRLPSNWRKSPSPQELANIGDRFASNARSAVLIVPSALAPTESNWLINPRHPEFSKIRLRSVETFDYDPRFLK